MLSVNNAFVSGYKDSIRVFDGEIVKISYGSNFEPSAVFPLDTNRHSLAESVNAHVDGDENLFSHIDIMREKQVNKGVMRRMKIETTNDIMKATREELIDYAFDVTSERNELKAENAELKARLKELEEQK